MPATIADFKEAFAGSVPAVRLPTDVALASEALKRLKRVVEGLPAEHVDRFKRVLVDLVKQFQAATTRPAGPESGEIADILRNTQAVIARAEAVTEAGNAGTESPPPAGQAIPEPKVLPAAPPEEVAARTTLQFNVQHDGQFIVNATVRIADETRVTDDGGMAEFLLEPGDHAYVVAAEGFAELSGTVEVSAASGFEEHGVLLTPLEQRRADVMIRVLDARTGLAVARALVRFGNSMESTNDSGEARFIGVARARDPYLLSIQLRGYETQSFDFDHTSSEDPAIKVIELEPSEGPTVGTGQNEQVRLRFNVQDGSQWIEGAAVGIASEVRVTDREGMAEFTLPPGVYPYRVSADGFAELTGDVEVSAAEATERHAVILNRLDAERSDVIVRVMDARTRLPINEAFVAFGSDVDRTDSSGDVRFIGVTRGDVPLRYEVRADGYARVSDSFRNNETDNPARLLIELQPASIGDPGGPTGGAVGEPNVPGGDPNCPVGEPGLPGDGATPNPLQDRTLRKRLVIPAEFATFRTAVIDWIDTVVVAERADPLVDASNLQEIHVALSGSVGQEEEIKARLYAGEWRYESVHFGSTGAQRAAPAVATSAQQTPLENPAAASANAQPSLAAGNADIRRQIEKLQDELRRFQTQFNTQLERAREACLASGLQAARQALSNDAAGVLDAVGRLVEDLRRMIQPIQPPVGSAGPTTEELIRRAQDALAELDAAAKRVKKVEDQLGALFAQIGESYQPAGGP